MQATRRDLLSIASAGAMGAATVALIHTGRAMAAGDLPGRAGRGPALEGPYLDLRTPRGNKLATARIHGDLDTTRQKFFWLKGYACALQPGGRKVMDLFGVQGFGAVRLAMRADGSIERLCREIILYTDLKTGAVLEAWSNPLTGETVRVVHVENDPINFLLMDYFPIRHRPGTAEPPRVPFLLPWYQHGERLDMETHVHLSGPNPLQREKWPRESSGATTQSSEFFAHHLLARDMQNPALTTLDYHGVWNSITPWLPWMLMGQTPGQCCCACFMGSTGRLEEIFDAAVLDYAAKHYSRYFNAPDKWTDEPSLPGLEHYARTQSPVR